MAFLPIAGCHIVENGVAPYVMHGICPGNAASALADDDRQFSFVVERH